MELENMAGPCHLADRLRQDLALLARQQGAELLPARQDLAADEVERVEALLRRRAAPLRQCGLCRCYRLRHMHGLGFGIVADHIVEIGRVDIQARGRGGDPLAADIQAVLLG